MTHLLDSNAVIAVLGRDTRLMAKIKGMKPFEFGIPSIVAHELYYGIYKSSQVKKNLARFEQLRLVIVDFDREDAQEAGKARAALAAAGTPIGQYDVLIAGQAIARNLTLVTRNVREFSRIFGLRFENWEDDGQE